MPDRNLGAMRTDYQGERLAASITDHNPWELFDEWLAAAIEAKVPEPNAMTLATVDAGGRPSSRVVLLKDASPAGLVFFTDYGSDKAVHLAQRPVANALFYWPGPMRQIRATGAVERISREESEAYFHSRPHASQVSAWVSKQSRPLGSREQLAQELAEAETQFEGKDVPLPDWGGFRVDVDEFEFWQGMPGRAHDRARFVRDGDAWRATRLYP